MSILLYIYIYFFDMFQQENEQLSNKIDALEEKLELQGKEVKSQNLEVSYLYH